VVAATPEELYAMVADVTRMGEWSPVCRECWWDDDQASGLGGWFTGRNVNPERTWETHCQVVAAEPGREFAFVVSANHVRWGYTFEAVPGGTKVSESWDVGPESVAYYQGRFGDTIVQVLDHVEQTARQGIAATLAAIKAKAEAAS
jgi:hypothetical protein